MVNDCCVLACTGADAMAPSDAASWTVTEVCCGAAETAAPVFGSVPCAVAPSVELPAVCASSWKMNWLVVCPATSAAAGAARTANDPVLDNDGTTPRAVASPALVRSTRTAIRCPVEATGGAEIATDNAGADCTDTGSQPAARGKVLPASGSEAVPEVDRSSCPAEPACIDQRNVRVTLAGTSCGPAGVPTGDAPAVTGAASWAPSASTSPSLTRSTVTSKTCPTSTAAGARATARRRGPSSAVTGTTADAALTGSAVNPSIAVTSADKATSPGSAIEADQRNTPGDTCWSGMPS